MCPFNFLNQWIKYLGGIITQGCVSSPYDMHAISRRIERKKQKEKKRKEGSQERRKEGRRKKGREEESFIKDYLMVRMGFPGEAMVKNLPAVHKTHEMWVQSLCQKDPLEEEMATHSGIICLENGQRHLAGCSPWGHTQPSTIQCQTGSSLLRCFLKFCPQSHVCVKLVQQCMHQTSSSDVYIHPCVTVTLFFSPSKIQDIDEKKSTNEEAQTSLSGLR